MYTVINITVMALSIFHNMWVDTNLKLSESVYRGRLYMCYNGFQITVVLLKEKYASIVDQCANIFMHHL